MTKGKARRIVIKIALIVLIVIFSLIACLFFLIGIALSHTVREKRDETNTVEYQAIVQSVEVDNTCKIYMTTYDIVLSIRLDSIIYDDYLNELQPGTSITFRLPEGAEDALDDGRPWVILTVSLRTENAEIVTLESYNRYHAKSFRRGAIITFMISGSLFLVPVGCTTTLIVMRVKQSKIKKLQNDKELRGN